MKKKKLYLFLLLAIVCVILLGIILYYRQSKRIGRIEFYLHDSSNLPVSGANVLLKKGDYSSIGEVETGRDGKITYYKVPEGSYIIEILELPEGYEFGSNKEVKFEVVEKEITQIKFECKRNIGMLEVTIVNSNGEPMENVSLDVYDKEGYRIYKRDSDSDGKIYVKFLENDVYYFRQSEEQENIEKENLDFKMYKLKVSEENKTFYKTIKNKE